MPKKESSPKLDRRKFLTAAAIAGASGAVKPAKAAIATAPQSSPTRAVGAAAE